MDVTSRRGALIALVLATGIVSGCWRVEAREPRAAVTTPERSHWASFFVLGIFGDDELDVREHCPAGATSVRTGGNAATLLVSVATVFVYTPRVVHVRCAPPAGETSP